MEQDKKPTRMIVRRWKDSGDIIAIMPDIEADYSGNAQSYMHMGQHAACSWPGIKELTRPVLIKPDTLPDVIRKQSPVRDALSLLEELASVGYLPKVGRYVFKDGRLQKWEEVRR